MGQHDGTDGHFTMNALQHSPAPQAEKVHDEFAPRNCITDREDLRRASHDQSTPTEFMSPPEPALSFLFFRVAQTVQAVNGSFQYHVLKPYIFLPDSALCYGVVAGFHQLEGIPSSTPMRMELRSVSGRV